MADKKVWFITGAGRGMGVDIARAAMAAGDAVLTQRIVGRSHLDRRGAHWHSP